MTVTGHLDAIDWKILKELQADGRLTNVELAMRVGLSPPPCLRRVRALEEGGYIAGYRALLGAAKLGFDVQLFAHVGLKSQAEPELTAFVARVRNWPLVRECYAVSGGADFILRCSARDIHAMQDFIIKELTAAPNVDSVKTTLILDIAKYEPGVPIT
jgi:DNA-binding Lrp family transcriptional regulator